MELETTRLLTAALQDPVYGVNALLAGVPLSPPDQAKADAVPPTFAVPNVAAIVNDVEDELVANEQEPAESPALIVLVHSTGDMTLLDRQGVQWETKGLVVGIAYAIRDVEPVLGRRYGLYTLRAARMGLVRFFAAARADRTLRRENSIEVLEPVKIQQERLAGALGRAALTGVLRVTLHVRDTAP